MSTNAELAQIKAMYPGLEKEVEKETSGNFRKVLMELLKCKRDESIVVNERNAEADADAFYRAGEKKLGTDDSKFIEILTTRSIAHLAAVDRCVDLRHVTTHKFVSPESEITRSWSKEFFTGNNAIRLNHVFFFVPASNFSHVLR